MDDKDIATIRARLGRIHTACMNTHPKQAVGEMIAAVLQMPEWAAASEAGAVPTPYAIQRLPAVRQALTAYHARPADEEACAVVRAILAAAPPSAPAAESAEPAERALLRRALNWMMTSKDRPNMLASLIHEALHGEPAYFALSAGAQGEIARAQRAAATAPAQLSGNSGELDAQGERAVDEAVEAWAQTMEENVGPATADERLAFKDGYLVARAALSRQPSAPASAVDYDFLRRIITEMDSCRIFVSTREKIHPDGLRLYDELREDIFALAAAKPEGGEV